MVFGELDPDSEGIFLFCFFVFFFGCGTVLLARLEGVFDRFCNALLWMELLSARGYTMVLLCIL